MAWPALPIPLEPPSEPDPDDPPEPSVDDSLFWPWPPLRLARQLVKSSENFL